MLTPTPSECSPPAPQPWAALRRLRDSALFRFAASGLLVLVLQIPIGLISSTIAERRERRDEAIAEVTRTWGGPQELLGPVVTIPFTKRWVDDQKVAHESVTLRRVLPRDLHNRPALAERAAQRVRTRRARLPLHRVARRPPGA